MPASSIIKITVLDKDGLLVDCDGAYNVAAHLLSASSPIRFRYPATDYVSPKLPASGADYQVLTNPNIFRLEASRARTDGTIFRFDMVEGAGGGAKGKGTKSKPKRKPKHPPRKKVKARRKPRKQPPKPRSSRRKRG